MFCKMPGYTQEAWYRHCTGEYEIVYSKEIGFDIRQMKPRFVSARPSVTFVYILSSWILFHISQPRIQLHNTETKFLVLRVS